MRLKELNRTVTANEVTSTYFLNNQTIVLTSTFTGQVMLEELIYRIALKKLNSASKLPENRDVQTVENVV